MIIKNNDETDLPPFYKHWCPDSETYCGGDGLLTLLDQGWELDLTIYVQTRWLNAKRCHRLYHCCLRQGDRLMYVIVTGNPFVTRLLRERKYRQIQFLQHEFDALENP